MHGAARGWRAGTQLHNIIDGKREIGGALLRAISGAFFEISRVVCILNYFELTVRLNWMDGRD